MCQIDDSLIGTNKDDPSAKSSCGTLSPNSRRVTADHDLVTLCFASRAMRDEAERVLYSEICLDPSTELLAVQLCFNHRQRRHITRFAISTSTHSPKFDMLPLSISSQTLSSPSTSFTSASVSKFMRHSRSAALNA